MTISPSILVQQLKRQLVFLQNSVAAYDVGCVEESIRIGVVIRVLCHDACYQSLLKQMGLKDSIQLVTTAREMPADLLKTLDFAELLAGAMIGNVLNYDPVPDEAPTISCIGWWTQTIFFRNGVMYSRKDLVLSATNKDGGAHFGAPDSKLKALQDGFWIKAESNIDGTTTTTSLVDNHFRMLRRFADELLKSQELLTAADWTCF
jgi:hypothetical protein